MERDNFPTFRRIGRWLIHGWPERFRLVRRKLFEDWRPGLRRAAMVLLTIFVVLAIPWTYFNITLGMKLERKFEEIRARGEPLTLEAAAPEMPPRDENAAYVYEEVFHVMHFWTEAEPDGEGLTDVEGPLIAAASDYIETGDPEAERTLREGFARPDTQARMETIARASRMEHCVFPLSWEGGPYLLFPHMAKFRDATRLVTTRAMLAAQDGDGDEALRWLTVGLRMSKQLRNEPTIIAVFERAAMEAILLDGAEEVLARVEVTPEEATTFRRRLTREDFVEHFRLGMFGERTLVFWLFDHIDLADDATHLINLSDETYSNVFWEIYMNPVAQPVHRHDEIVALQWWDEVLSGIGQPYREARTTLWPRLQDQAELPWHAPVAHLIMPIFSRAHAKRDAAVTRRDQFNIALALNLYRQEHGEYPRTLEPLAGTVDWPIPDDIFSGEPFGYRREGEGYVLWSVGPDLDDDGGVGPDAPGQSWEDSDIVWRVEG
jgi:hypothetical protein